MSRWRKDAKEYREFADAFEELQFEKERYTNIASKTPEEYDGLADTQVKLRMSKMVELILQHEEPSLNIGVGFGQLETMLPKERKKMVLDICPKFFERLRHIPNLELHEGIAEAMPFPNDSIPTITSQSTFQVLTDQRAFLRELGRVLKPDGWFAITIEYKWNYARKPQLFYVDEIDELKAFIKPLRLDITETKILSENGEWVDSLDKGFSLWILGTKQPSDSIS